MTDRPRLDRRSRILAILAVASVVAVFGTAAWIWVVPVAMERTVRGVLLNNPEIILEAVAVLRLRDEAEQAERRLASLAEFGDALRHDPATPFGGNPDGDVTVVEFYDYKCQFCRQFHPQLAAMLAADPGVRFVFREFPILGPESTVAARASLAAALQAPDLFLAYHDALMETHGFIDEATVLQVAAEVGLDPGLLAIGMNDPRIDQSLEVNFEFAAALGIDGTPGFVIGDVVVPGFIEAAEILRLVQLAREECKTC